MAVKPSDAKEHDVSRLGKPRNFSRELAQQIEVPLISCMQMPVMWPVADFGRDWNTSSGINRTQ
jgi:hypothetical protein